MPDLTPDIERELEAVDDALRGRRVASDLSELGELVLLLREDRPQPSDDFSRRLDARVERGFDLIEPAPRAQPSRERRWKALFSVPVMGTAATALLIAVVVIAGPNGAQDDSSGGGSSGGPVAAQAPAAESDSSARAGAERAAGATADEEGSLFVAPVPPTSTSGSPGVDGRENRKIERSASLTLAARPRDIDTVSARIQEVTRQQGGFVVASTVSSSTGGGSGTFELRIPTRNLDAAMAALSRLGKVRERAQRSQDITAEAVSARSRLTDARTERTSLLRQLGEAVTPTATASIRARLRIVSEEIERARAGLRRVNNRASFSTVAVTLVRDRNAAGPSGEEDDNWTPGDAADDALRVLEVAAGVMLIALALALPLAVLGALAAFGLRATRRRRREHALDAV